MYSKQTFVLFICCCQPFYLPLPKDKDEFDKLVLDMTSNVHLIVGQLLLVFCKWLIGLHIHVHLDQEDIIVI